MKIVLISNSSWSLVNFRGGLLRSLVLAGYDVVAMAPGGGGDSALESMGVKLIKINIDNKGTNPFVDLLLSYRFYKIFKQEKPDLVISYTIKPVIYAGLAARVLSIPVISVITGLGTVFIKESIVTRVVEVLYRISQAKVRVLFFINTDDMDLFKTRALAPLRVMQYLPGEGVDLSHFARHDLRKSLSDTEDILPVSFLLIARMLWDKGVGEFVEAAQLVKLQHPSAKFALLGFLDAQNPSAISKGQVEEWATEDTIEYLGAHQDVRPFIAAADCIVLPSYREGVPRVLLEAAAMERPVIATDVVGCREVVKDGVNGFLCEPRNAGDLAEKILHMISLPRTVREEMGRSGHALVAEKFDEKFVISKFHQAIASILGK